MHVGIHTTSLSASSLDNSEQRKNTELKTPQAEQLAEPISTCKQYDDGRLMAIPLGLPGGRCFDLIIMTCTPEGFRATGGGKSDICWVEIAESSTNTMMIHQDRGRKIKKKNTES